MSDELNVSCSPAPLLEHIACACDQYINDFSSMFLFLKDCVAFAIQEVIRIFAISNQGSASLPGHQLWNRFPEHIQEIMLPLFQSK